MVHITQGVILAGGLGTRLRPFTDAHPKPLYPVGGHPFLDHLLRQLQAWGLTSAVLLLGYMADQIVAHVRQNPVEGLDVSFDLTPVEYDTAGRLVHARSMLNEAFLLAYCDNYCPLDFKAHVSDFASSDAVVRLCAYANADGYTKSNLCVDANGMVTAYDKARRARGLAGVDIGYALVRREALDLLPEGNCADVNFEATVYPRALELNRLSATVTEHRYYSIGGWERMPLTERFFTNPPTVFLDRDGTLNERPPKACYVTRPEDFRWLPGARESVAAFKRHGWRVLLFTNQPGIARGMLTEMGLAAIHENMRHALREAGADVDGIYVCPHGWDEDCDCRKPKPGLLYQAQKDFCLDLTRCVVIGDDERDMESGRRAGCRCEMVSEERPLYQVASALIGHAN